MITKLKDWLLKGVILRKVLGKYVKHAIGALAGMAAANPVLKDAGVTIDWNQLETWAVPALIGLFGAAWNYIEHRFIKKPSATPTVETH